MSQSASAFEMCGFYSPVHLVLVEHDPSELLWRDCIYVAMVQREFAFGVHRLVFGKCA